MEWLTTKETATLLNITDRQVRRTITGYRHREISGKGRGGFHYEIALDSLPKVAQKRYFNQETDYEAITCYSDDQRYKANQKAEIIRQYQETGASLDCFVKGYNKDHQHQITESQLYRWQRKLKEKEGDISALIDGRGGSNRGQCSIDETIWDFFLSLYLCDQKPTVKLCYDKTAVHFTGHKLPSVKTFQRKVDQINPYAILYHREGKKAFNDSLPYMERDYSSINSNDVWFSDHHLADVFVRDKKGKIGRPWITMWTDARSRKVMSQKARMAAPNADIVKEMLRIGVESFGVPHELYVDNGKDYKTKDCLCLDYPLSIVNRLGINTIYATKYHGQAKSIERFFGTLEDRLGKQFASYAGKDAKARPESLQDLPLEDYPTLEEYQSRLNDWIDEYNVTRHRGNSMYYETPNHVYADCLIEKRVIQDKEGLRFLFGRTEERVVQRNGINIFNNSYWHDALVHHLGKKVQIVYDSEDLNEMNVLDEDGRAICIAKPRMVTPFRRTTAEDYQEAKRRQKAARKAAKEYEPVQNMGIWQLVAQQQAEERRLMADTEKAPNTPEIDFITSTAAENIQILRKSNTIKEFEEDEEDITKTLLEFYQSQKAR